MATKQDVWQGTLALMILKTLETLGPLHGYGIARRIEQTSGHALLVNYGTLYPALLKLTVTIEGSAYSKSTSRKRRLSSGKKSIYRKWISTKPTRHLKSGASQRFAATPTASEICFKPSRSSSRRSPRLMRFTAPGPS